MPRMSIEERRRALIQAAIRVVAREGVAAATTRAIATEAGMPLASFHYAFASRDELLRATIAEVTRIDYGHAEAGVLTYFLDPASIRDVPLDQLVRLALESYLDSLEADPGREQAMLELALTSMRNPSLAQVPAEQYLTYFAWAEASLQTWEERAGIAWTLPMAELSRILVVVLDGMTTTWLATRDTEAVRACIPAFSTFLAGLAAPRSEPSRPGDDPAGESTHDHATSTRGT